MAHDPNSEKSEHTVTRAINAYKDSDSSVAANLIVERFESRIYALARKRAENMKVRNDLADLVNESFFKLFQQLKQNPENIANSDHLWTVLANILKTKKRSTDYAMSMLNLGAAQDEMPHKKGSGNIWSKKV